MKTILTAMVVSRRFVWVAIDEHGSVDAQIAEVWDGDREPRNRNVLLLTCGNARDGEVDVVLLLCQWEFTSAIR